MMSKKIYNEMRSSGLNVYIKFYDGEICMPTNYKSFKNAMKLLLHNKSAFDFDCVESILIKRGDIL